MYPGKWEYSIANSPICCECGEHVGYIGDRFMVVDEKVYCELCMEKMTHVLNFTLSKKRG